MEELKTLKDFEFEAEEYDEPIVASDLLRAEAIKWVRMMDKNHDIGRNIFIIYWIDFFNIIEDDLK